MKKLEDWLETSSSSSSRLSAPSAENTAHELPAQRQYTEERITDSDVHTRQKEMRMRMRHLLGDDIVNDATTKIQRPAKDIATTSYTSIDESSSTHSTQREAERFNPVTPLVSPTGVDFSSEYRPVEVMVVDRGTQTTTTVGCQTEPLFYCPNTTGFPVFHSLCNCGGMRRSCMTAAEEEHFPAKFREQLDSIRNSVDMVIARYNLPPPPTLPRKVV